MTNEVFWGLISLALILLFPLLLYLGAKLVSFGVSMGRHRFNQYLKREQEKNGKDEKPT